MRASRLSVHEALREGGDGSSFGDRGWERALMAVRALPRPLALSLRTTLRDPAARC